MLPALPCNTARTFQPKRKGSHRRRKVDIRDSQVFPPSHTPCTTKRKRPPTFSRQARQCGPCLPDRTLDQTTSTIASSKAWRVPSRVMESFSDVRSFRERMPQKRHTRPRKNKETVQPLVQKGGSNTRVGSSKSI